MRIRILSAIVGLVIALTSVSWAAIYKRGAFSNLTVLSSAANAVTINSGTLYILNGHITVLGTGSSMTGLNDQGSLIDVTNITSTGVATFTNATVSGTILGSSNGATTSSPVITYNANGTKSPSTIRAIQGSFVGNGGTVTVSFSQPIFIYVILLTNETGTGASIAPTTTSPSGFTLASSASGQTYTYFAVGN